MVDPLIMRMSLPDLTIALWVSSALERREHTPVLPYGRICLFHQKACVMGLPRWYISSQCFSEANRPYGKFGSLDLSF
jgi:hypothetical protein